MTAEFVNAFVGRRETPADRDVTAVLGKTKGAWDRLLAELTQEFGLEEREWNSYSPKAGWSLRLKKRGRNILYLSPGRKCFMAALILGDRAIQAARANGLPRAVNQLLDRATKYPEGWGIRLRVSGATQLGVLKRLVQLKLS